MNSSSNSPDDDFKNRRRFLKHGTMAGAALATGQLRPAQAQDVPDDPSKILGNPVRPYGERSPFEQAVRVHKGKTDEVAVGGWTPLDESLGIITPSALHYEVHRGGVPAIDPARHRLMIHGLVDRPVILNMEEIRRLPAVSRILFLECQGNTLMEWQKPKAKNVQISHGWTSCSEWTGVPLSVLLREVGVQSDASWIIAEGADASGNERSIPIEKAMDDVLVAYGQNGEPPRPGERVSTSTHRARMDRQHQCQVATTYQGGGSAVSDSHGRDGTTRHRRGRKSLAAQLLHGGKVGYHLTFWWPKAVGRGFPSNQGPGLVGSRISPSCRGIHGCRGNLA